MLLQQDDTAKLCQAPSASSPLRLSPKQKLSSDELAQASALLSSGSAAAVAQAAPQAATKPTADAAANDAQATTPASTAASATASMQSSVSGPSKVGLEPRSTCHSMYPGCLCLLCSHLPCAILQHLDLGIFESASQLLSTDCLTQQKDACRANGQCWLAATHMGSSVTNTT